MRLVIRTTPFAATVGVDPESPVRRTSYERVWDSSSRRFFSSSSSAS